MIGPHSLALSVTAADGLPDGATIEVAVEHDDGYVSFATVRFGARSIRCCANTAERSVRWEIKAPDWQWDHVAESTVDLPSDLRKSMARAAHAGLVACGARSVS